ncbi:MAG: histidine--tRNA ligase [Hyphomicrobiaceae bacterium]|nr:histidine--tRNA ligase [Hyphomicrobiaceae bacterium]
MGKNKKPPRLKARLPKGLRDIDASEIRARDAMLRAIRDVYESYGFEPLDTPAFEYTDALGKFLPDQDRPNEGVFSFQDEDEQWLSLRYDLTAPLARHVAENYEALPKPFRRYQTGSVWRNEKPGPGRFREFIQFDADTVGASSVAADAEMCMLAADALEALGVKRGDYVIRVNNRKVLDGVLSSIGIDPHADEQLGTRLTILRALDKYERLGSDGVKLLLGDGRKDESGDFTKGAGLTSHQTEPLMKFVMAQEQGRDSTLGSMEGLVQGNEIGQQGIDELRSMDAVLTASGCEDDRVAFDPSIVRGLDYYTGPVFEAELTFEVKDEKGRPVRFGSVGGGGRYDGLVARFKGQPVPATGFSIGVSRLYTALTALGQLKDAEPFGPVVVSVFDKAAIADYQALVTRLRDADIRAELYLGNGKMGQQFKYADQRGAPCVVIQGPDEKERGEVQVKDLIEGAKAAQSVASNEEWRSERPAQFAVSEDKLVEAVREVLARHRD